jgi:IclR family pca regulon transcriptional regulator
MARPSAKAAEPAASSVRSADDEYIPSLEKALAVLELFNAQNPEWTLSQVARELQLTPGSSRRILRTLELLGYAVSNEGRFRLTSRVLNLGFAYLSSQPFVDTALPLLRELAIRLSITCSIAVLDEREVVYVARAIYRQFEPYYVHVGARFPAYATAPGKVLLAGLAPDELECRLNGWKFEAFTPNTLTSPEELQRQLAAVRQEGWAINDQEMFVGQRSIAVPLTIGGAQTAAVVATATVSNVSAEGLVTDLLPPLRAAADEIQRIASAML